MVVELSDEARQLIALFETETDVTVRDCLIDDANDRVIYVVKAGEMADAIGPGGRVVDRFEERLDRAVTLVEDAPTAADFVAEDGGTYAFVHQTAYEFDDAMLSVVTDATVVFLPPVTFRDDGTAAVEAVGQSDGLSDLYDRLRTTLDADLERVRQFRRRDSAAALTDRQREALRAARAVGYYDVPRPAGVSAVADELDCGTSTAGELLRKAEAALVDAWAGGMREG